MANWINAAEYNVVEVDCLLNRLGIFKIASNCRCGSLERIPGREETDNKSSTRIQIEIQTNLDQYRPITDLDRHYN